MTTATATDKILYPQRSIISTVLRCVTTIAGLSLLAKGMGFIRDAAVASKFGTGDAMDAYTLALSVPTLMAGLFCGAVPAALIPAYAKVKQASGKKAGAELVANGIYLQLLVVTAVCLILGALSNPLMNMLAGEFSLEKKALCQQLFLLLLVFTIVFSVAHTVTAALQAEKYFALGALTPALIPVVAIGALFTLSSSMGVFSLAIGLIVGTTIHLGLLLYALIRVYGIACLKPNLKKHDTRQLLNNSLLILLGGAIFGGCVVIDLAVASRLPAGTVATFGFADKVTGIVLSLAGVALGQTLLPYLADMHAASQGKLLRVTGWKISRIVVALTLPAVVVIWIAATPITQLLFERGQFGPAETARVADALRWGSLQFPAAALGVIASSMVVVIGAVRYMCMVSVIALIANVILDLTLAPMFGLAGILCATAIVHTISTALLFRKITSS